MLEEKRYKCVCVCLREIYRFKRRGKTSDCAFMLELEKAREPREAREQERKSV